MAYEVRWGVGWVWYDWGWSGRFEKYMAVLLLYRSVLGVGSIGRSLFERST